MRLQTITILGLTLAGFALRLHYLTTSHPFFDEYTTVLAARQILKYGWPVLPSGLFYEHGLLSTYVIAPFTALFINTPVAQWQPAHWGLMLSRWPSALLGTITIPLIYTIGCRANRQSSIVNGQWSTIKSPIPNLQSPISLLAAGLFALSPEGMVWGGRARMYALATLLVLLTVYWAFQGAIHPAPARYRWWTILTLLATLLTQFGALMLVPPLVIGMVVAGWLSYREAGEQGSGGAEEQGRKQVTFHVSRSTLQSEASPWDAPRIWFLRPPILAEALALAAVVGLAVWVKRLGQPLGAAALGSVESGTLPTELLDTVTYQTAFHFTWPDTVDFFAQQFGPPHLFWLALVTAIATVTGLAVWLASKWRTSEWRMGHEAEQRNKHRLIASSRHPFISFFNLFLWLIFSLIILQMVTLLDPFRRNPRYIVMYLPLFYLIAANAVLRITLHASRFTLHASRFTSPTLIAVVLLLVFTTLGFDDLRVALVTPEPAYEEAFDFIQENWQPNDALLTMNTPAAGLYLGRADGFTVQDGQDDNQFLLDQKTVPVDRWLGAPWLGTAADFNAALNAHQRVWFVIDTIRQPVYFRGDWQAVVSSQMEQIWANDNALIYRTRPDRVPLSTQPDTLVNATLADSIELIGCTLQTFEANSRILAVTLFWRPLRPLTADYTVFLHLRNNNGATVVQHDGLPLNGAYPTSRWQPGEMVIDPFTLLLPADLPAGQYTLWAGLYQLETLERLPVANDTSGENAIRLGEINYQ